MRELAPEVMDDPGLDPGLHEAALRGLARLNRLSRASGQLFPRIERALRAAGERPILVDVGAGSADVSLGVWQRAQRNGIDVEILALDKSEVALKIAQARGERLGVSIRTVQLDAISSAIPRGDVVLCSLFLHHLTLSDATDLLRAMSEAASHLLIISDLRRCLFGRALAGSVPWIATRSPVVHTDAVRSVRAAFTLDELRDMSANAGLDGALIHRTFPARMTLEWSPQRA